MRYANMRYMKSLFTKNQKQQNLLEISLLFKEIYKLHGQITREFLGLRIKKLGELTCK